MAKILVVDDSPTQLTNLVKMVENQGHEAITASNGMEGIEKARAQKLGRDRDPKSVFTGPVGGDHHLVHRWWAGHALRPGAGRGRAG